MEDLKGVNEQTLKLIDNIEKDLKKMLSDRRYTHSRYVMMKAVELANIYGVDVNKAALAGLTHDITKEFSRDEYLEYAKSNNIKFDEYEEKQTGLMHGKIGAAYVKNKYGLDEDIQNAIALHTITDPKMTDLDKIIFVSDKVEETRQSDKYDIEYERELSRINLDKTVIVIINQNIIGMIKDGKIIHPNCILTRNYLLENLK